MRAKTVEKEKKRKEKKRKRHESERAGDSEDERRLDNEARREQGKV